jgi:hypothetical protein
MKDTVSSYFPPKKQRKIDRYDSLMSKKDGSGRAGGFMVVCAQHGRVLTGASPVVSWSQ